MEKVSLRRDIQRFSSSQRNSGIDFQDVFGGPPRSSSSMQYMHDDDETSKWRSSWSCSGTTSEKPVFGEEHVNRRRYTNDYFFDDIFDAEKQHLDSPGSRILSPVRPSPPKLEPFAPSSLPAARFSLPANLSKAINLPAFGSAAHTTYKTADSASIGTQYSNTPDMSPPRFSSEAINCQEELMHDVRSYRPSPLSRQISLNSEESITSDISDKGDKSRKDFDSENTKSSSQFHFSIYKWAGIGVPSLIPIRAGINSRLKEKSKVERSSSFRSWIASKSSTDNLKNPNDSPVADTLAADKNFSRTDYGEDGNELFNNGHPENIMENQQTDQKSDPSVTANMNSSSLRRGNDIPKNHTSQYAGTKEGSQCLRERVAARKTDEEIPVEAHKSEARSLNTLFSNEEYDRGSNRISSKSEVKEDKRKPIRQSSAVNSKQKKQAGDESTLITEQVNKCSLHATSIKKGNDEGGRKVKGKVKDFVKIFNQEASSSSEVKIDSGSPTNRCRDGTSKEVKEGSVESTKTNDKMQAPNVKAKKMYTDASIKADEYLKESVNRHSARKTSDYVPNDTYAGQKDSSDSNTASIPDRFKTTEGFPEEYLGGTYQVNDVFQAEDEPPKKDDNQDVDTKIRKWSKGKEGNIRSLLSTLQYVLWPGSGWKPVPLVDIIEGNAVKKAYQKALLCLHPDKLQQKGASSHQKYIAEKVFDILQEAWDHFSSLNTF